MVLIGMENYFSFIKMYERNHLNKGTALEWLYQEVAKQINFKENKIISPSNRYYPVIIRKTTQIATRKNAIYRTTTSFYLANL